MGPLPLRRKALGILYYLALEGPTRRERLADLLWDHGASLQNLRVELHHLRRFFGKESFQGQVLQLPPGVEVDRAPGPGEAMEGLEAVSPAFADWVRGWRDRLAAPAAAASLPERLKRLRPPALVILIGPPGSGREALAQALARHLGLPFRWGLAHGPGVFYFGDHLPAKEVAMGLRPTPGQVLVVARSAFGEDPTFLLVLRASFPPEITVALEVPRLTWKEAREGLLWSLPFAEAARFYLNSGGRLEVLKELLAMGDPEALPQRIRAMVALEARYLSQGARRALEVLSLHPGPWPVGLAEALGVAQHLDELEHRRWVGFGGEGYRLSEPQFRRFLQAHLVPGERLKIHRRMAAWFRQAGDPVAEAYHLGQLGAKVDPASLRESTRGWRRALVLDNRFGRHIPQIEVGWGPSINLEIPEEICLVSLDGQEEGFTLPLEEPTLLHLSGYLYQELPLGMGSHMGAYPLRLRGGERSLFFLPRAHPGHFFWGTVLPAPPLDYPFLLPSGVYRVELGTPGVALLRVRAYRLAPGREKVLVPLGVPVET